MPQQSGGTIVGEKNKTGTGGLAAPWKDLAASMGITDAAAYQIWHDALVQSDGSVADTLRIINETHGAGAPTTAPPPGGPGGGGSGGGSGGGGMTAADRAAQIKAAEASFASMVRSWGMVLTPRLEHLIHGAAANKWNSAQFTQSLRGTKEYHLQFPGIQWKKGMSEATYNSQFASYQASGQDAGYGLSRHAFAHILKKGISTAEWALRVNAVKQIKANAPLLENFREELVQRGVLKPNEKLNPKEVYKLATGRGSAAWTSIWNEASVETGLEGIGITVGKGDSADLSRKELGELLKVPISKLGASESLNMDFAGLAKTAADALPASRLYGMGITKKDLVTMALGGKKAPEIAQRVELAIGTARETAMEQRAAPQLNQGGMQGGPDKVQSTE